MTTRGSEMTKKLSTDLPKLKRNYGILKIQQENATALYIIAFLILIMVFLILFRWVFVQKSTRLVFRL